MVDLLFREPALGAANAASPILRAKSENFLTTEKLDSVSLLLRGNALCKQKIANTPMGKKILRNSLIPLE